MATILLSDAVPDVHDIVVDAAPVSVDMQMRVLLLACLALTRCVWLAPTVAVVPLTTNMAQQSTTISSDADDSTVLIAVLATLSARLFFSLNALAVSVPVNDITPMPP